MRLDIKTKKAIYTLSLSKRYLGEQMIGYSNRCKDGLYILTLDYDSMDFEHVKQDCERLIQDYLLSGFHLFETNKGYHAVCFDKFNLRNYLRIARASSCDPSWLDIPILSGKRLWVLRTSDKHSEQIRFVGYVDGIEYEMQEQSQAHFILLDKLFRLDDSCMHNPDKYNEVQLAAYPNQEKH